MLLDKLKQLSKLYDKADEVIGAKCTRDDYQLLIDELTHMLPAMYDLVECDYLNDKGKQYIKDQIDKYTKELTEWIEAHE